MQCYLFKHNRFICHQHIGKVCFVTGVCVCVCFKIALDFQILHPEAAMCLFQRWTPDLVQKILDMAVAERKVVTLAGLGPGNVT